MMMMMMMIVACDAGVCSEGDEASSSSSHRVSALASALADKMLESPEVVRLLEGGTSSTKPSVAPKSVDLSSLCPAVTRCLMLAVWLC